MGVEGDVSLEVGIGIVRVPLAVPADQFELSGLCGHLADANGPAEERTVRRLSLGAAKGCVIRNRESGPRAAAPRSAPGSRGPRRAGRGGRPEGAPGSRLPSAPVR